MIPPEMAALEVWLRWEYKEIEQGKLTKVPLDYFGIVSNALDPKIWMSYDKVRAFPKIGFVLTKENGILGIDLDDVLKGGVPLQWAEELVTQANTYTEISPSQDGLHLFGFGSKPEWLKSRIAFGDSGVEVYDSKRFFTVTGKIYQDYSKLTDIDVSKLLKFLKPRPVEKTRRTKEGNEDFYRVSVHSIISGYQEGIRYSHPFHGSTTGINFVIMQGGEVWYCFRHGKGHNALHLLGQSEGVIQCEDSPSKEQWSEIFRIAKSKGLISDPADRLRKIGLAGRELEAVLSLMQLADLEKAELKQDFADIEKCRKEIDNTLLLPQKKMMSREKNKIVERIAYSHLHSTGKFFFDKSQYEGYWFDSNSKQLWQLSTEKFASFLSDRLQVNQEDSAFRWILQGMKDRVSQHAKNVKPQMYSLYDETNFILYINNKPGRMLRVTEDFIQEVDNGDGALFLWQEDWQEFDFVQEKGESLLRKLIYEQHSLDSLSFDDLAILLHAYIQSVLFRSLILHRPILTYVGPWGCGKTLMQVLIGVIFFGKEFDVLGMEEQKQDAAIAYITNSVYGVFDNADEKIKWLPDLLARVATGNKIPRRKLYTTNTLVNYPVDCLLGISARTTPWARPDIISRTLLVKFVPPTKFVDEKKTKNAVIEKRLDLISEVLRDAQTVIKRLKQTANHQYESPSRLAGFYSFGMRISDDPQKFAAAFDSELTSQNSLAAEEEEVLVSALKTWLEFVAGDKDVQAKTREWTAPLTTSDFLKQLKGPDFVIRTTSTLTRRIKENQSMLRAEGIVFSCTHSNRGTLWSFKIPTEMIEVRKQKQEQNNPSQPSLLSNHAQDSPKPNDGSDGYDRNKSGKKILQNHAQNLEKTETESGYVTPLDNFTLHTPKGRHYFYRCTACVFDAEDGTEALKHWQQMHVENYPPQ